jgi:hypothetical protein
MAARSWEYMLPTGERLEVRLDDGVESVFLGPRLVSRSPAAARSDGHTISLAHGDAAGPFRGGGTLRVVVAGEQCEVTLDGHPLETAIVPPVAQPGLPPHAEVVEVGAAPGDVRVSGRALAVIGVLFVGGFAILLAVIRARDSRPLPPRVDLVRNDIWSANARLHVWYPSGWTAQAPEIEGKDLVVLGHATTTTATFAAMPDGSLAPAALQARLRASDALAGATPLEDPRRESGRCAGHEAEIENARVKEDGVPYRTRACSFHNGATTYRYSWAAREADVPGETPALDAIFAAAEAAR